MDDLEKSNALSCLQIETLVYACQVTFFAHLVGKFKTASVRAAGVIAMMVSVAL